LDGPTTPSDNLGFAFLGDVCHGTITTVYFPDHAFDVVDPIMARPENRLTTKLPNLLGAQVLDPLAADDPVATLVLTRRFMYLPFRYVSRFLDAQGYTIREAWDLLLTALEDDEAVDKCKPLLEWLRASSQVTRAEDGCLSTPITSVAL
jgi:hypothetical protein